MALLRVLFDEVCKEEVELVKIALDKPLVHFIPKNHNFWGKLHAPSWAYKVTLHHLLSNTSGLNDVSVPEYIKFGHSPRSRQELVSLYNQQNKQLSFAPGSKYEYSNPNFFFAGLAVEALTGKTLGQYLKSTFFSPLKMNNTFLADHGDIGSLVRQNPALSLGHHFSFKDEGTMVPVNDYFPQEINQGDGGMVSTVTDLITWNQVFYETDVILPKPVKQLMLNPIKLANSDESDYGYGISIKHNDKILYSHEGLVPGFHSVMYYEPIRKITLVHLSNLSPNILQFVDLLKRQEEINELDTKSREEQEKVLESDYPTADTQYEKNRLIQWEDFEKAINQCIPTFLLHLEQEKVLYSWSKKLLEEERMRQYYAKKIPNTKDGYGYGPGALVVYKPIDNKRFKC